MLWGSQCSYRIQKIFPAAKHDAHGEDQKQRAYELQQFIDAFPLNGENIFDTSMPAHMMIMTSIVQVSFSRSSGRIQRDNIKTEL